MIIIAHVYAPGPIVVPRRKIDFSQQWLQETDILSKFGGSNTIFLFYQTSNTFLALVQLRYSDFM